MAKSQKSFNRIPKCVAQMQAEAALIAEWAGVSPEALVVSERARQCSAVAGVYGVQAEQARDIVALAEAVDVLMAGVFSA